MTYQEFCRQYHIRLNERQLAAVQNVDGSILLLAVPGSGKTTVLITRLGYMIHCCGIAPEEILTMTYTVSATRDMSARFAAVFGQELADRMEFRTINGVCAKIIRRYEYSRETKAFELVSDEKQTAGLLSELYRSVTGDFATESDLKSVRTLITYAKNMQISGEELDKLEGAPEHFSRLFEEYNRLMRSDRRMDYDDQMQYAFAILRKCPDILEECRKQYRYICVDEAQDTSKIQHRIISLLAGEKGNLFMVGDEDQSIYSFRAAWPEALVNFEKERPGAKVLLMETNYRSTDEIISAADRFIQQNRTRHPKHMCGNNGHGAAVREIQLQDRNGQYAYLQKVAQDCRVETAVLYRDNDCALPLISYLEKEKIPYRCRQVDSNFFTNRSVLDITDIILLAVNPCDKARFLQVYYKFNARIPKSSAVAAVRDCPEGRDVLEYLIRYGDISDYTRDRCRELRQDMRMLLTENGAAAVRRILGCMGYAEFLESRKMDRNKAEILKAIGYYEPDACSLLRRLEELRDIVRNGSFAPDSKLILSTVHSSKGLEYERVYLMDVFDGVIPPDPDENGGGNLEEERRIFYVAMTRAKSELCIFTFKRKDLRSSFSDAVFRTVRPAADITVSYEKPKRHLYGILSFEKSREKSKDNIPEPELHCGDRVWHKKFGSGIICENLEERITVDFDECGEKSFDRKIVIQKRVLQLEKS